MTGLRLASQPSQASKVVPATPPSDSSGQAEVAQPKRRGVGRAGLGLASHAGVVHRSAEGAAVGPVLDERAMVGKLTFASFEGCGCAPTERFTRPDGGCPAEAAKRRRRAYGLSSHA